MRVLEQLVEQARDDGAGLREPSVVVAGLPAVGDPGGGDVEQAVGRAGVPGQDGLALVADDR